METENNAAILIVDDTPENIEMLGHTLSDFRKYVALNGEKALKLAAEKLPDLILLDVMMPGIDGYEVIQRLKQSEQTKDIPVIFITALSDVHEEAKGFELGAADYITKPFKPEIVRVRVKTQLLLKEQQKALLLLNQSLTEKNAIIEEARATADRLLNNILPSFVIKDLKNLGKTEPRNYPEVTVMFVDIAGFSKLSSSISPAELIDELNEMFSDFDEIISTYGCERIKTIGDGYMAVCGVPEANPKHAQLMISAAIDFIAFMNNRNNNLPPGRHAFEVRVGINSGPVVGGVVGTKKYIYDIFGDTVNIASRMETYGEATRIAISGNTYELVKNDYQFEERGQVDVKGIGLMTMYLLEEKYTRYM